MVNALLWGVSWWPFRALQQQGVHGLWATALVFLVIAGLTVAWDRSAPARVARTPSLWPLLLSSGIANAEVMTGVPSRALAPSVPAASPMIVPVATSHRPSTRFTRYQTSGLASVVWVRKP